MVQTGESLLRRRVTAESEAEFPVLRATPKSVI
jgi:hypothetical protein